MTRPVLERALYLEGSVGRGLGALLVALLGHGALVALALEQEAPPPRLVATTDVELLPPPAPPPAPEPEPTPEASPPRGAQPASAALAPTRPTRSHVRRAAPPPPASAAPLRTIDEAVPAAEEPVRFVTDPHGAAFGVGAVAQGGTAASAPRDAAASAAELVSARGQGSSSAPVLSRAPRLGESDPCRGYFPERARVDQAEVALRVRVERDGRVQDVAIAREHPAGQGFGSAARACLLAKRFTPALDRQGREVAVVSPVTVRFSR